MTCSNDRKITFLLQKKDSKATNRWQGGESVVTGKCGVVHNKAGYRYTFSGQDGVICNSSKED
jgi:hypothetical protein